MITFRKRKSEVSSLGSQSIPVAETIKVLGNVSPASLPTEFEGQIGFIQLCCNYFQFFLRPAPKLRFSMPNYLESIVLQLCSIVLILFPNVLAPILRCEEVVFGAQSPIANFEMKMVWSVGFQLCSIMQDSFLIVLAFLLRFGHPIICTLEVNDGSSSP